METIDAKWDATRPAGQWLASQHLAGASSQVPYRIDGWLAATGTSVWFGAGSTGKTQLLLWMAATIASTARPATWLGRTVNGTGHVLILTAEDSREQVIGRIDDIVRHTLGQTSADVEATCSRLHVMPFLSMTEDEFKHPNASLLGTGTERDWQPTPVLLEIRRYIEDWNEQHDIDDRIVGVIMDSATSMAGFDTIDGFATTNFFFYLGRLCEKLRLFWTVIGHQPKVVNIGTDTRSNAAARLRGAAMWTTAPRMTVEVRLIQEWKKVREAEHIRAAYPDRRREDFVVVYVAKANLPGVQIDERYLLRSRTGAFEDVTMTAPAFEARPAREKFDHAAKGQGHSAVAAGKPARDWARGTLLVAESIRHLYPDASAGAIVAAQKIFDECRARFATHPDVDLVLAAHGGKKVTARDGSVNWHLDRLVARGALTKNERFFRFATWDGIGSTIDDAMQSQAT